MLCVIVAHSENKKSKPRNSMWTWKNNKKEWNKNSEEKISEFNETKGKKECGGECFECW